MTMDEIAALQCPVRVTHSLFGDGTAIAVNHAAGGSILIEFDDHGRKELMSGFCHNRLTPLVRANFAAELKQLIVDGLLSLAMADEYRERCRASGELPLDYFLSRGLVELPVIDYDQLAADACSAPANRSKGAQHLVRAMRRSAPRADPILCLAAINRILKADP